jgi:glutaredoxin-related protein
MGILSGSVNQVGSLCHRATVSLLRHAKIHLPRPRHAIPGVAASPCRKRGRSHAEPEDGARRRCPGVQSWRMLPVLSGLQTPATRKGNPMPRSILGEAHIHPAVRERIATYQADIVKEVQAAVAANNIVIVGMRQNPHPKQARKALDAAGLAYKYLEYGSYFSEWYRRLALKMWTGWPTFPMVFVKGELVGGADDLARLLESGALARPR